MPWRGMEIIFFHQIAWYVEDERYHVGGDMIGMTSRINDIKVDTKNERKSFMVPMIHSV